MYCHKYKFSLISQKLNLYVYNLCKKHKIKRNTSLFHVKIVMIVMLSRNIWRKKKKIREIEVSFILLLCVGSGLAKRLGRTSPAFLPNWISVRGFHWLRPCLPTNNQTATLSYTMRTAADAAAYRKLCWGNRATLANRVMCAAPPPPPATFVSIHLRKRLY